MNNAKTVITAIAELLLGKKYYANIINTRGTDRPEISCHIFSSPRQAERHKQQISSTSSYQWIETISFRSKNEYTSTDTN